MSPVSPAALLTVPELAARLRVTPQTIYCWIAESRIEVIRLGRNVRITPEQAERLAAFGVPARPSLVHAAH